MRETIVDVAIGDDRGRGKVVVELKDLCNALRSRNQRLFSAWEVVFGRMGVPIELDQ